MSHRRSHKFRTTTQRPHKTTTPFQIYCATSRPGRKQRYASVKSRGCRRFVIMCFVYSVSFVASHCVVGAVANVSGVLLCVEVRWSKQPFRDRFHLKNACGPPQVDNTQEEAERKECGQPCSERCWQRIKRWQSQKFASV